MSATEVQICNMALLKFGDVTISSLSATGNREQKACYNIYPLVRDYLLYSHNWNFAMTRADISDNASTTPDFQWSYAYTLPDDCMRVWELWGTDDEWQVESGELLTDKSSEIYIRYIKIFDAEDTDTFNPAFVRCASTLLAAELASKLKGDMKKRQALLQELINVELPIAYRLNAIEGNRALHKDEQPLDRGNFSWQKTGYSGDIVLDEVFSS